MKQFSFPYAKKKKLNYKKNLEVRKRERLIFK